jgi:prepilin-type N-terminal cleavage/methylation domain-containing protein
VLKVGHGNAISQNPRLAGSLSTPQKSRSAFTLVELLVVIGIIAVLVAILLPALNRARQQANLIACQSQLRQVGQALGIYVTEHSGYLPYGDIRYDPTATTPWLAHAPAPNSAEFSWYWDFTLSQEIQANTLGSDQLVHNLSPIFVDSDVIQVPAYRYVNHYTCNPRIFPDNWEPETQPDGSTIQPQYVLPRKISNIKPSSVFMFWEAPQCADWNNNAYEQATEVDANQLTYGTLLFLGTQTVVSYTRPALPGGDAQNFNASFDLAEQKKYNIDLQPGQGYFLTHMRFRHMNNTTMNALCVDGHVETRAVGTITPLDICIQSPG